MRRLITWTMMIVLLIVALISTASRESQTARARTVSPLTRQQQSSDGVRRVTIEELRAAMEKGAVLIVDVRGDEVFKAGHIKGAISIPGDQIASRTKGLPRDKLIVAYCS